MAITAQLGYSYIMIPDYDKSYAYNTPILGGFKYSIYDKVEGMPAIAQLGIHAFGWGVNIGGFDTVENCDEEYDTVEAGEAISFNMTIDY